MRRHAGDAVSLGPLMIDVGGLSLTSEERERLAHPLVGGVILFARNFSDPAQLRALSAEIHGLRQPALLIAVDQEGGRIQRFREGFTALPSMRWLGEAHRRDADAARHLAHACGWLMAAELVDAGVDLSFAPCVDLDRGLSEVIGDRALHREAEVVASLALAYMQGMRQAGMAAVAKHFPGHGAVVADSHHELPVDQRPLAEIEEDMLPYRCLIGHGLAGLMVAHVRYPRVDARIASLSPAWMRGQLRERLGFRGAIFTDDLSMAAAAAGGEPTTRVHEALEAGADMALVCNDPVAAGRVLDGLHMVPDPAGSRRLAALRAVPGTDPGRGVLREGRAWQLAARRLADALGHSPMQEHG